MSDFDRESMQRALSLAASAYGETSPNPMVGAVVTSGEKRLGEAAHRRAGLAHAEPQALDAARRIDPSPFDADSPRPWTLHVNLEPCVHQGRTPPCVDAILAAPVGRVSIAHIDPDPRVAGRGVERLRAAGLRVDMGRERAAALELNHVFVSRVLRGRAFVALKVALSADDCIARAGGGPTAITGIEARRHAHRLRAGLDAVLIGVETLKRDRPKLDRRLYEGPGKAPRRVVLDPDLRSDPEWLWPGEARPVLFCRKGALGPAGDRLRDLAHLVPLPERGDGLDLEALPEALAELGIASLLVEGGGRTHLRFLEAGLWDRLYLYRNSKLKLAGLPWAALRLWSEKARGLEPLRTETLGGDNLGVWVHPATVMAP